MATGVWIALGGLALTILVYAVRAGGAMATVKRDTESNKEEAARIDEDRKACREQMEARFERVVSELHKRVDDFVKEAGRTNTLVAEMRGELKTWMRQNGSTK